MSRGKRYDGEPKLNIKKVIATALIFAVIIMLIVMGATVPKEAEPKVEVKMVTNSYKAVYTSGKWGVINSKGEIVVSPTYDEMIVIPNDRQPLFICQKDVDLDKGTYKSIAINDKSEQQFAQYDNVEIIQNIDNDGQVFYYDNTLKVEKEKKYGLINFDGKELLPCEFDSIDTVKYLKNSLITSKNGKIGLVDNGGNIIIDNEFAEIQALTTKYEDGYIVKNIEGKFGVINYNKKKVLECKYDAVMNVAGSNMYVVKEDNNTELINANGEVILKNKFEEAVSIDNENIVIKKDDKYGIIAKNGDAKVAANFQLLKYLFDGNYLAKKDNKYGIINLNNETIIDFIYKNITYMNEAGCIIAKEENGNTNIMNTQFEVKCKGIVSEINSKYKFIKVRENDNYKYYNFKLEEKSVQDVYPANTLYLAKQNGKYGFVNKKGIEIVNYLYDDATEQNDYGYAAVKKDGKWGVIDSTGKVVVEPTYELAQNTLISFIGRWHLAPDLNANYYTDTNE